MRVLRSTKYGILIPLSVLLCLVFSFQTNPARASSSGIVISQIYGGGGSIESVYQNDFIEIFNAGSNTISLNSWSVQYANATTSIWNVFPLTDFNLKPGQYYLVQLGGQIYGSESLPNSDATSSFNISATNGKVAVVSNAIEITGAADIDVVDFVGYGTANEAEGTVINGLSTTDSASRKLKGCTDTNDNSADFTVAAAYPNARNSATALNPCISVTNTSTPTNTTIPTDTPTNTATSTPTDTPTNTSTNTPTSTSTDTPTNTATATSTPTSTFTLIPTNTSTSTPPDTPTSLPSSTSTPVDTPVDTATSTDVATATDVATVTNTPLPPTSTPSDVPTSTSTPTDQPTLAATATATATATASSTTAVSSTATPTVTIQATLAASPTSTDVPVAGTELLINGGMEQHDANPKMPDHWTGDRLIGDKLKCNTDTKIIAHNGLCAFQFKGGIEEKSKLLQNIDVTGLTLNTGDLLQLSVYVKAVSSTAGGKIKLRVKYTDGTMGKATSRIEANTGYTEVVGQVDLVDSSVAKIKLQVDHKSTGGKVYLDDVSLKLIPAGALLPLP